MTSRVGTSKAAARGERRRVGVLVTGQVLGGVGVASGIAIGGLLAQDVSGSTSLSGLAQTSSVLGAALLAVPLANLARARGRGIALSAGYALGFVGSALAVLAAVVDQFWLLLVAITLFGGGTTAGLQARYAATDGVAAHRRGRTLSVVVWATTIGSVAGPNLLSAGGTVAGQVGVPALSGPFLFSMVAFVAAAVVVLLGLPSPTAPPPGAEATSTTPATPTGQIAGYSPIQAPDSGPIARDSPLEVTDPGPIARDSPLDVDEARARQGTWAVLRQVVSIPHALLGLAATAGGHAVMVAVMVMTPVHLGGGHASLRVIGLVISAHVAGMYALSPLFGWGVDRFGSVPVIGLGVGILAAGLATAATAGPADHTRVGVALTLLGLGWSACLVAGSSLLSASVPEQIRTSVQGAGDLVVGICAAAAGVLSGPVLELGGYTWLSVSSAALLVPVLLAMVRAARTTPTAQLGVAA